MEKKKSDLTYVSDVLPSLSTEEIMVYLCASLMQLVVDPKECLKKRLLLAFLPLMWNGADTDAYKGTNGLLEHHYI